MRTVFNGIIFEHTLWRAFFFFFFVIFSSESWEIISSRFGSTLSQINTTMLPKWLQLPLMIPKSKYWWLSTEYIECIFVFLVYKPSYRLSEMKYKHKRTEETTHTLPVFCHFYCHEADISFISIQAFTTELNSSLPRPEAPGQACIEHNL